MLRNQLRICRKLIKVKICCIWIVIVLISIWLFQNKLKKKLDLTETFETIHLAAVSCGRPNHQGVREIQKPIFLTITMIKSAILFTRKNLHIHIFTEEDMTTIFDTEFQSWPEDVRSRTKFSIHIINYNTYLTSTMSQEWKKWYKPCGSYRLFLPMILKDVTTAAIYSDSDVIFIKPIEQLWSQLKSFKGHQSVAISPTSGHSLGGSEDNENFIRGRDGIFQINSGVLVMNFTKMLNANWLIPHDKKKIKPTDHLHLKYGVEMLLTYYSKYKEKAEHDQKLLNIIFHFNPDLVKQMSCSWNFKNNFCQDNSNVCDDAEKGDGAGAVHGITSAFFGLENPTFRALYEAFLNYDFEENISEKLLQPFLQQLESTAKGTFCMKKSHAIIKPLTKSINQLKTKK